MSRSPGAQWRFAKSLRPIGQAILGADIEPLVKDICRRIRQIRHRTAAGTFVLADADGFVYLLGAASLTTDGIIRRELALLVGAYASQPQRPIFPTDDELRTDLIAHFFEVGFLKPEMIYGQEQHSH